MPRPGRLAAAALAASALLLTGCVTMKVASRLEPGVDVARYRIFDWAPAAEEPAKPVAPKPVGNAVVRFLPPQVEINAQGPTTVALIIENATDVSSAPLQVTFDSKVVKLNDAGRGDFFSSDGQIPVFTKNIQNDAGAAAVNLNRLPNTPGVSGSGMLTQLTFQAVAKGSTTVTVPNLTVRNAQGQVVFSGSPQLTINVK